MKPSAFVIIQSGKRKKESFGVSGMLAIGVNVIKKCLVPK